MALDASTEGAISYADLQDLRTILITVHTCLSARDLSDSAANTLGEVRYRPLTREVERVLLRVKGILGDLMMEHIDEIAEVPDVPDMLEEDEEDFNFDLNPEAVDLNPEGEEDLAENPLGSRTIYPRQDSAAFEWDDANESA